MANLDAFKAVIENGIRPNQFAVELTSNNFTDALGAYGLSFMCHATSIPGSNVGQAPVFHRGRMIPLVGERSFDPWTVVIYADQGMKLRSLFENWSNDLNNYSDNSGNTDPSVGGSGYRAEGFVKLLDRNNDMVKTWKVNGIFPINISEMQLSWQANDVVAEFSVTFAVESFDPFVEVGENPIAG